MSRRLDFTKEKEYKEVFAYSSQMYVINMDLHLVILLTRKTYMKNLVKIRALGKERNVFYNRTAYSIDSLLTNTKKTNLIFS